MAPVSSRAPLSAKDAPTRAVLDSQRTISDQLGHLDLGDVNRTEHPKSPLTETAEERLRRIKGKAHITDTPTSRDREPRARSSSIIIRDPENRHQTHQHPYLRDRKLPLLEDLSMVPLPTAPSQAKNALTQTQDIDQRASLPMTSAKGYLKKLVPKNPRLKGQKASKASKKLNQL
ncbi:unnamed protein product [Brassica oleracea]|uniref:(rape) hypothetical protein n=1 Tax=Brassica napus TaxID=3708 RepID=A0A816LK71_BRANA|nr:unnamed protein product [Brassica napus]